MNCKPDLDALADQLIETCRDCDSVGLVYRFLLRELNDVEAARAEFKRYLTGELSKRLLQISNREVADADR